MKTMFNLPLDQLVALATDGLSSARSRRSYGGSIVDFVNWYKGQDQPLTKALVCAYKAHLQTLVSTRTGRPLSNSSVNVKLSAIRKLVVEAAENGLIDESTAASIKRVTNARKDGVRSGNWLSLEDAQALLNAPDPSTKKGKRDRAVLAVLLGCALRREECAGLTMEHIQYKNGRWAIVDLIGKRDKVRTVPMPDWVKSALDDWIEASRVSEGSVWRAMRKGDNIATEEYGEGMSSQAVWRVVTKYAEQLGAEISPLDLRRTAAKLMLNGGARLDQISLTLGHESLTVTTKYLGLALEWEQSATDKIGLTLD